jgi:hypothetical protein
MVWGTGTRGVPARARAWGRSLTVGGGRVALVLLAAGCGYSTTPGRVRPGLETVAVPYFENRSEEPEVEVGLTEAVINGLIADRTLKVVEEGEADALVLGTIKSYAFREAFFGSDRQAEEYKIMIAVEVSLVDRGTNDVIAGPQVIRGEGAYLISEGAAGEAAARTTAAKQIVDGILNLVIEEW